MKESTYEELLAAKALTDKRLRILNDEIRKWKSEYAEHWLRFPETQQLQSERTRLAGLSQDFQAKIARAKRVRHISPNYFFTAAKKVLDEETFNTIEIMARGLQAMAEEKQEKGETE